MFAKIWAFIKLLIDFFRGTHKPPVIPVRTAVSVEVHRNAAGVPDYKIITYDDGTTEQEPIDANDPTGEGSFTNDLPSGH